MEVIAEYGFTFLILAGVLVISSLHEIAHDIEVDGINMQIEERNH